MELSAILPLLAFIVVCFLPGMTGVFIKPGTWYEQLNRPSWRPPNRLFAPVWAALYLMISIAGWLVWRQAGFSGAALPLSMFALNLVLNAAWTPLFFGLHRPDLGLIDISLVWLTIAGTILLFLPVQLTAGLLLLPYLVWVSFATALNFSIWRRNR